MIYSETYRIRNYEADPNGRLWLHSLANYLQDVADRHATELGAGVPHLLERGLSWVLYRLRIDIHRWPQIPEEITVTTNPSGGERVYVFRDYRVYDKYENLIASASSTWLVFDLHKRKLTPPQPVLMDLFDQYKDLEYLPRAGQKFPGLPPTWLYRTRLTARHNEIDQNEHVNNSVYFQWLLEPLPVVFLRKNRCTSLEIMFKTECLYGETIHSVCQLIGENIMMHRLENERGDEISTAISTWIS
jgi:medium-chain acyl-[acyl-carrier-protein] hydrolase